MLRHLTKKKWSIRLIIIIVLIIVVTEYHSRQRIGSFENGSMLDKLIIDRLKSHSRFFDSSSSSCSSVEPLTPEQKHHMDKIGQALTDFRRQIKPSYAESQFHRRRGIVLSAGVKQLLLTKINLKMIESTRTRLPVQVE